MATAGTVDFGIIAGGWQIRGAGTDAESLGCSDRGRRSEEEEEPFRSVLTSVRSAGTNCFCDC